jgi:hypothetical protein
VFLPLLVVKLVFLCAQKKSKVLQIIFNTNILKGLGHEQVSLGQGPRGARNNNGYSRALFNVWFVKKKSFPREKIK